MQNLFVFIGKKAHSDNFYTVKLALKSHYFWYSTMTERYIVMRGILGVSRYNLKLPQI